MNLKQAGDKIIIIKAYFMCKAIWIKEDKWSVLLSWWWSVKKQILLFIVLYCIVFIISSSIFTRNACLICLGEPNRVFVKIGNSSSFRLASNTFPVQQPGHSLASATRDCEEMVILPRNSPASSVRLSAPQEPCLQSASLSLSIFDVAFQNFCISTISKG